MSSRKLQELMERDLSVHDFVALMLDDGKRFGKSEMVTALGITMDGKKVVLGFVETVTENETVCGEFLQGLMDRWLSAEKGQLVVLDGAKRLRKVVERAFAGRALVQRCQWHKRENVVSYLGEGQKEAIRGPLQHAYSRPTLVEARRGIASGEEGALPAGRIGNSQPGGRVRGDADPYRLGLFREPGISLKTTNSIESLHSLMAHRTDKVDYWKNSNQRQRWVALRCWTSNLG